MCPEGATLSLIYGGPETPFPCLLCIATAMLLKPDSVRIHHYPQLDHVQWILSLDSILSFCSWLLVLDIASHFFAFVRVATAITSSFFPSASRSRGPPSPGLRASYNPHPLVKLCSLLLLKSQNPPPIHFMSVLPLLLGLQFQPLSLRSEPWIPCNPHRSGHKSTLLTIKVTLRGSHASQPTQ